MDHLQEKFQITAPPKPETGDCCWTSADGARKTGQAGFLHQTNSTADGAIGPKFNNMPPGMDSSNQLRSRAGANIPLTLAGETDVTNCVTPKAMRGGFTRVPMSATEDQFTGEHVDLFYGQVFGQDEEGGTYEGFAERNNYLDRV